MDSKANIKEDRADPSESGFYCDVCDCVVKDSLNYLDHINGKKHNKNLGIILKKFTDCTFQEVKDMLELKKRQRDEKALGYSLKDSDDEGEGEKQRRLRQEKRRRQKASRSGNDYRDDDKEDDPDEEDDEDDDKPTDEDDTMARLMGFSNFGSSK